MIEDGRQLLIDCLETLSGEADLPTNFHELQHCVEGRRDLTSHFWCDDGCLVSDVLEALPPSLYEHEATLSLLIALEGEIVECVRCLQAYHTAQVWIHPFYHYPEVCGPSCLYYNKPDKMHAHAAPLGQARQGRAALACQETR